MKNIILTGLFFIICFTSKAIVVDDLSYQLNEQNKTAIVYGLSDILCTSIQIPDIIQYHNIQYTVVGIRKNAFKNNDRIEDLFIVKTTTSPYHYTIGDSAFAGCTKLRYVKIFCDSIVLGNAVFNGCSRLQTISFTDNVYVLSIGDKAFKGCISLTAIFFPKKVYYIGKYAFKDCISLDSITIPEGVTKIEYAMFEGCKNLKRITISSSLKNIENYAFWGCTSLDTLKVRNIDQWCQVDKGNIYSNPLCYSNGAYLYQKVKLNNSCEIDVLIQSVTIRSPIVKSRSFFKISNLTVTLNSAVKTVEEKSFFECPNIHLIYQGEMPVNAVFRCENATYN